MNQNEKDINLRAFVLKGVPFCWQEVKTMGVIRKNYNGKKLTTAIATYQTLTELASIAGRGTRTHTNQFPAYIKTIAERVGKSESTIKRYTKEFKNLKIITWENRRKGKMNLANLWKLLVYSGQDKEPTSQQNKDTNPKGHNNGPVIKEALRKSNNNKGQSENYGKKYGLIPLKDIIHGYKNY